MKRNISTKWLYRFFLLFYAIFLLIMIFHHEVTIDESQAWNLSRDLSLFDLVKQMQQEGHSCLWHFILMPFSKLGFPILFLNLISAVCMWVTAFLILYKSPFHFIVKLCIVCSSPFLYFYSVISRVYCLIPLILSLLCIYYPKRSECPCLYCLLIALLAHTHIVMAGLSGMFFLLYFFEFVFKKNVIDRKKYIYGVLIVLVGYLLFILQINQSFGSNTMLNAVGITYIQDQSLWFNVKRYIEYAAINFCDQFHQILGIPIFLSWMKWILVGTGLFLLYVVSMKKVFVCFFIGYIFSFLVSTYIWFYNVSRSCLLIFFLVFFLWMVMLEFPQYLKKCQIVSIILSILCIMTIPYGSYKSYKDYIGLSSGSKMVAEYIDDIVEEDAVIVVTNHQFASSVAGYIPNTNLFYNEFQDCFFTLESWASWKDDKFTIREFSDFVMKFPNRPLYVLDSYLAYKEENIYISTLRSDGVLEEIVSTGISEENENYTLYKILVEEWNHEKME